MGIIKTQSIYNTIIIYIGIGLGFISTIYLYPNVLTPDEYGLTRLLLSVALLFTQFAHMGMNNISIKFFPYFEDKQNQHNGFFFLTLVVPFLGFLLFLGVFFLFSDLILDYYSDKSELFVEYFPFLIPLVLGILYFDVINSYVRARYASVPGSIIGEVVLKTVTILLLILFLFKWLSFYEFMVAFVCSYILKPLLLIVYLYRKGELFLKPKFNFIDTTLFKRMGNYGLFSILGGMANLIVNNIDIIMLGSLSGLANTGIYAIAFYVGSVIEVPKKAIGKIVPTVIAKNLADKDYAEVANIYKSSSINQVIPGALLFIGIWANLENLLAILPEEYSGAGIVILIIGAAKLINMGVGVNGVIILNSEHYRFDLVSTIFLVIISILTNYLLIPIYGIAGAALATALSILIYNTIKGVFLWVNFKMQPFTPKIITVVLLSGAVLFASLMVDRIGSVYVDIFIRSFTIAVIYSTGIILFNVSDEVNKIWTDIKKKIL